MAIIFNDNVDNRNQKPVDNRQGKFVSGAWQPFDSVAEANSSITYRYKTLTVPILVGGLTKEYWYKDGILDGQLIEKFSSGAGTYTGNADLI